MVRRLVSDLIQVPTLDLIQVPVLGLKQDQVLNLIPFRCRALRLFVVHLQMQQLPLEQRVSLHYLRYMRSGLSLIHI